MQVVTHESMDGIAMPFHNEYRTANEGILRESDPLGEHCERSRNRILDIAEYALHVPNGSGSKRALILGPGICQDIPVDEIVESFDHTRFVEIDTTATERVLSGLTSAQLGKVSLIAADVSGFMADFSEITEDILGESLTYSELVARFMLRLKDFPAEIPRLFSGENNDFVCSHLLMSQLTSLPFTALESLVANRFKDTPMSVRERANSTYHMLVTLNEVKRKVHVNHVAMLANTVMKGGVVHLADTVQGIIKGTSVNVIDTEAIRSEAAKHFDTIGEDEVWIWTLSDKLEYYVSAMALKSK